MVHVVWYMCIVAGEKVTDRKKKKKKEKKKKKKKDRIQSHSPNREAMKPTSPNSRVTEHNTRDASPLVRVKPEFPAKEAGKFGRHRAEKHVAGHKNDVRVKEEVDRRDVNSADNYSHQHRSPSPPRLGTNVDVRSDSRRFPAVDRSRLPDYVEKNGRRETSGEDRSRSVKSEGQRQDCQLGRKQSTKNRDEEMSGPCDRRGSQGKKRMRSTSPCRGEGHQRPRVVDQNRSYQHRSLDCRDGRPKTHRKNGSSSDDDCNRMQSSRCSEIVKHETHHHRSRSPDNEHRKLCRDDDHSDRDNHRHRHRNT